MSRYRETLTAGLLFTGSVLAGGCTVEAAQAESPPETHYLEGNIVRETDFCDKVGNVILTLSGVRTEDGTVGYTAVNKLDNYFKSLNQDDAPVREAEEITGDALEKVVFTVTDAADLEEEAERAEQLFAAECNDRKIGLMCGDLSVLESSMRSGNEELVEKTLRDLPLYYRSDPEEVGYDASDPVAELALATRVGLSEDGRNRFREAIVAAEDLQDSNC